VKRYADYAVKNNDVESASENLSKMVSNSQNVELWIIYLEFVQKTGNSKKAFDQAIEQVGLVNPLSSKIWEMYIDHEMKNNRLAHANLLSYLAIETPLKENLLKK
jgi:hypothetical protein